MSTIQSRIRFHFKNKISFVENGLISKEMVDTTVSYTNITMKKRRNGGNMIVDKQKKKTNCAEIFFLIGIYSMQV